MPKEGKNKWLSTLCVFVYNASIYPKSDIYSQFKKGCPLQTLDCKP